MPTDIKRIILATTTVKWYKCTPTFRKVVPEAIAKVVYFF